MNNLSQDIAIDLGTSTVVVYVKNKGIVLREPSIVAVDNETYEVLGVGESARRMLGRTPRNISTIRPLKERSNIRLYFSKKDVKIFYKKDMW